MHQSQWIISQLNKPNKDRFNILTGATHEGYQSLLDQTGHNFFMIKRPGSKLWNKNYRPIPEHHFEISNLNELRNIDFILSQEKFGFLQYALNLQRKIRLPIIHIEHTEPQNGIMPTDKVKELKSLWGDINVFITDHNRYSWGKESTGIVIPHGIDTELFNAWNGSNDQEILYVVNFLKERDVFCGHQEWLYVKEKVQQKFPNAKFKLVGDNGKQGVPAKNINELIQAYRNCACYINTSRLSPIPMSLMEAMSVGCPIVSTAKQQIPTVIDNGYNGFCSNNLDELADKVCTILLNKELGIKLGTNARKTIEERYNMNGFINNWNDVFSAAYNILGKEVENAF